MSRCRCPTTPSTLHLPLPASGPPTPGKPCVPSGQLLDTSCPRAELCCSRGCLSCLSFTHRSSGGHRGGSAHTSAERRGTDQGLPAQWPAGRWHQQAQHSAQAGSSGCTCCADSQRPLRRPCTAPGPGCAACVGPLWRRTASAHGCTCSQLRAVQCSAGSPCCQCCA